MAAERTAAAVLEVKEVRSHWSSNCNKNLALLEVLFKKVHKIQYTYSATFNMNLPSCLPYTVRNNEFLYNSH